MCNRPKATVHGDILQAQIVNGIVTGDAIRSCMKSVNIADRAKAYLVLTDFKNLEKIQNFMPDKVYPAFCVQYLLDCIKADTICDLDSEVLNRSDAMYELRVPMNKAWNSRGVALSNAEYWEIIEIFLLSSSLDIMDDFVTHFLEGVGPSLEFSKQSPKWRSDPILCQYMEHLDLVLNGG